MRFMEHGLFLMFFFFFSSFATDSLFRIHANHVVKKLGRCNSTPSVWSAGPVEVPCWIFYMTTSSAEPAWDDSRMHPKSADQNHMRFSAPSLKQYGNFKVAARKWFTEQYCTPWSFAISWLQDSISIHYFGSTTCLKLRSAVWNKHDFVVPIISRIIGPIG